MRLQNLKKPIGVIAFGCLMVALTGCNNENRLAPAFSTLLTVPPDGYILTVVTQPIGATCYISGARDRFVIEKTPGTISMPMGYEGRNLICEKQGYQTSEGIWYVQPIGGNTQYIIQRQLSPL
ncbi:hypothetical protein E1162_12125 [Rhodobacteraceae bacterium RKSG542]|uniref:hypothetical protein n=1 Tax=Pseudovibrio flavus TaxID=2529854 RepID=UPI0012BC31B6|nr:hypothetical protein [Pseudovibrio flavus]MTI17984.1 hypothetical protein [Pseudovibrio flavus]